MTNGKRMHKILCVDDEPENLEILRELLVPRGYDLEFARNGVAAIEHAADIPDLILLDVVMPRMSGFEVLETLRRDEKTRMIPVVVLSALHEIEDRIKALEVGCDDFISKPFNENELIARVKSLLTIKTLRDEAHENYIKLKKLEETKNCLTHMIVHDLNSPLTVISGLLQMLESDLKDRMTESQRKHMKIVFSSLFDLGSMIADLLDVNKMEEGRMKLHYQSFFLSELAKEVVDRMMCAAAFERKVLTLEGGEDLPPVFADKELIRRVIANLIGNALKFTQAEASVIVRVFHNAREHGFYVQVKDTGAGIPQEYLKKLFDKFFQVESANVRIGRGLGLTFCKMAVEAHGGRIWAESEGEDKGSTFTFTIPNKRS